MKLPKIHEIYKGYEIELIRGKFDHKDSMAHAVNHTTGKAVTSEITITPKEALENIKSKIDSVAKE